jgi:HEAT repeat protein
MLKHVAQACIKAGIVSQAIDRLASNDRRQAYEAFSLLSLLAKANEIQPIIDAIEHHKASDVRLCAVRVLGLSGQPEVAEAFRQLAGGNDIPEAVRAAILDVIYKIDQAQPAENFAE